MSLSIQQTGTAGHTVRMADEPDVAAIEVVLAAAFEDDPVCATTTRNDRHKTARLQTAFRKEAQSYVPLGLSTIVESSDGTALGAGLWTRHDQWQSSWSDKLRSLPVAIQISGVSGLRSAAAARSVMHNNHPDAPHYYLCSIGVRPDAQGQGVASTLFDTMLSRCDREQVPAYLEASTPANVRYYRRYGFTVLNEFDYGLGGPSVAGMWREPA